MSCTDTSDESSLLQRRIQSGRLPKLVPTSSVNTWYFTITASAGALR
jgi:hypothetical protein